MDILQQALGAVKSFKQLSAEEMSVLLKKTSDAPRNGRYELISTAAKLEATPRHPERLE